MTATGIEKRAKPTHAASSGARSDKLQRPAAACAPLNLSMTRPNRTGSANCARRQGEIGESEKDGDALLAAKQAEDAEIDGEN